MIPFVELRTQYLELEDELKASLEGLFTSCQFVLGEEVERFEREFADYLGVSHVVGVGSGTEALHLALLEAGIGAGDEVILPAFTFVATALAVTYTGATPVFADIDDASFNIDCSEVERRITERTKAVIPVHLYGQCADMDRLLDVGRRRGITVIEDACQAHGAGFKGKKAGTLGRSGCFSFYPGKNLGAYGDGGAVATNDPDVASRLALLRNYGQNEKYSHGSIGYNSRLDSIQAAMLSVKLKRLDGWNRRRGEIAALYDELLRGRVSTPVVHEGMEHVFHIYAIRVPDRDALLRDLREAGVGAGIHYPVPLHLQGCFANLGYGAGDLPVSERTASEVLSLPMYPEMKDDAVRFVAAKVIEYAGRNNYQKNG